ncbi:MAG: phosphopantetheine-binding protein [Candidatus Omnitrophota bacterium]|jgi:acyl carrier protein
MKLFDEIKSIISEQINMPPDRIEPKSILAESLFMDYVDIIQLAIKLEIRYGIELPDSEIDGIVTVQDLVDHISAKVRTLP